MSRYDWLLVFHLFGAFLLLSGATTYQVLQFFAARRERPSEVATLLGAAHIAELAIQLGAMVVLVFGIWLAYTGGEIPKYGITDAWVIAALVLWVISAGLGERGGRIYNEARKLAERLAGEGNAPSAELGALVRNPRAAALTFASYAGVLVILVLMIWKPGAP